jgi:hypothetical protein
MNHPDKANKMKSFFEDLGYATKDAPAVLKMGHPIIQDYSVFHFTPVESNDRKNSNAEIILYVPETEDGGDGDFRFRVKPMIPEIKEDFVVSLDIDEYWVMPKGISTFADLITTDNNRSDVYIVYWLHVPNDNFDALSPPYANFRGSMMKYMARTSKLETLDVHGPLMQGDVEIQREGIGDLLHFWSRTFTDPILKGMTQTGTAKGCEGSNLTIELLKRDLLPDRLRILAVMTLRPKDNEVVFNSPVMEVDKNLEMELASEAFDATVEETQGMLTAFHDVYERFKKCLSQQDFFQDWIKGNVGGPGGAGLETMNRWLSDTTCMPSKSA